jgi:uncharacterized protein YndB with AHSA1/START domain
MTAENPGTIVITRRFAFSIERVFDAWLDPAKASKFLFTTPTGKMVRVEIDARVGGSFNITRRDGDDVEHVRGQDQRQLFALDGCPPLKVRERESTSQDHHDGVRPVS